MRSKWTKIVAPVATIALGALAMYLISLTKAEEEQKQAVDIRQLVSVEEVLAEDYQAIITSFGEVTPFERTYLAAQVSGEVIDWHKNFVSGGVIQQGEVLFSIEKDRYEAALLQATASVSQAESALIQERAQAAVAENEAKGVPSARVTDLYLRKPQLLSAEAALKSAQANLKLAQRDLENAVVRAPYDALIVSRGIGKGQFVAQGEMVAELFNLEYAEVTFPIAGFDTTFLPKNLEGLPASIKVNQGTPIERDALIVRDIGIVDGATRMSQLVARIPDPYGLNSDLPPVKFGSYAEVSFTGQTLTNVFRLPQELVTNQTVWVVDASQRLEPRKVTVLREQGEHFLISDGLYDSEQVVTTLPDYPRRGMEIRFAADTSPNTADDIESVETTAADDLADASSDPSESPEASF